MAGAVCAPSDRAPSDPGKTMSQHSPDPKTASDADHEGPAHFIREIVREMAPGFKLDPKLVLAVMSMDLVAILFSGILDMLQVVVFLRQM